MPAPGALQRERERVREREREREKEREKEREALRILQGPPQLASPDQIRHELPQLFNTSCQPIAPSIATQINPTHIQQIRENMAHILKHHPKHRCPGPAGERYEHYSIVYKCPAALEALTDTLTHLAANRVNAATMNASTTASDSTNETKQKD